MDSTGVSTRARRLGQEKAPARPAGNEVDPRRHRERLGRTLLLILGTYLLPFLFLTTYLHLAALDQRRRSQERQLSSTAEYQAQMMDLFIRERSVNLVNLVDQPLAETTPSRRTLQSYLELLRRYSETFVDVGVFDREGVQTGYSGPYPVLERRDYGDEAWFRELRRRPDDVVITDIYLGFRQRPHFTIAVNRTIDERFGALRATLDPDRIYEYITSLEGARELHTSIINLHGTYQFVTPGLGTPLDVSLIVPPREPRTGTAEATVDGRDLVYGYAWMAEADWALITLRADPGPSPFLLGGDLRLAAAALGVLLTILVASYVRARKRVAIEEERDESRRQLEHAAKLASVGELASGIAHEINNPLAIVSEEAGLIKDLMDPRFGLPTTFDDLHPHLDNIHDAAFRCRDITRKLLGFVRRADVSLERRDAAGLMDEVLDDFFVRSLAVENIEIERDYAADLPEITTDANQLKQVFLNILGNAADAIAREGRIVVRIARRGGELRIAIADDGAGMTREQIDRIYMPFYTTKEVGKGTGLGLSVSYGIVKSLGGRIEVESAPGRGSTFTIVLPVG